MAIHKAVHVKKVVHAKGERNEIALFMDFGNKNKNVDIYFLYRFMLHYQIIKVSS